MALHENFLICIFMNINENLKNEGKTIELNNEGVSTNTHISAATQSTTLNLLSNLISRHSTFKNLMVRNANYLIFIFMKIYENIKNA